MMFFIFISISYSIEFDGYVTYYDIDTQTTEPLAEVTIQFRNGGVVLGEVLTDENGYYYFDHSVPNPDWQITIDLFFENDYVLVQNWDGNYHDYYNIIFFGPLPEVLTNDFPVATPINNYNSIAKLFRQANFAAHAAIDNGYNPPQIKVKYPAQSSVISNLTLSAVNTAFFWPFETMHFNDLIEATVDCEQYQYLIILGIIPAELTTTAAILAWLGSHDLFLTSNSIFIPSATPNEPYSGTVFHEYGHFLHKNLRGGNWPVSLCEYMTGDEIPTHTLCTTQQSPKQSFVEGFADFYQSIVEGLYFNPETPYEGYMDGEPDWFEDINSYTCSDGTYDIEDFENGAHHEFTVAKALFDLYDPIENGDIDFLQVPLSDIFDYTSQGDNTALEIFTSIRDELGYSVLAPLFYSLDLNNIQHSIADYSNFYKLDVNNEHGENNLGGNLTFQDDINEFDFTVNSTIDNEFPVMVGNSYTVETHLIDHPIYNHLNWVRPEYYKLKEGNYLIVQNPDNISAKFDEKHSIFVEGEILEPFELQDPWYVRDNGTQTGTDWIEIEESYEVFQNQNEEFISGLPIYSLRTQYLVEDAENENTYYIFMEWVAKDENGDVIPPNNGNIFNGHENSPETPVVFTDDVAEIEASYYTLTLVGENLDMYSAGETVFVRNNNSLVNQNEDGSYTVFSGWEVVFGEADLENPHQPLQLPSPCTRPFQIHLIR